MPGRLTRRASLSVGQGHPRSSKWLRKAAIAATTGASTAATGTRLVKTSAPDTVSVYALRKPATACPTRKRRPADMAWSAHDGEQSPGPGHAFEFVFAAIVERVAGPGDEIFHR